MTRRKLRPDEVELWRRVAASLHPLRSPRPVPPAPVPPSEPPSPHPPPRPLPPDQRPPDQQPRDAGVPRRLAPFRIGEAARPAKSLSPPPKPPRIDAGTLRAMKRGRRAPEARIDLHGLTLAEAYSTLTGFLYAAQAADRRLVLVITGKGGRAGDEPGAIRREVPYWLTRPPLAGLIQDIVPAHRRHGGAGALYVYLRRSRR